MANEINIQLTSVYAGAAITAQIKQPNGSVAQTVTLTEQSGFYFTGNITTLAAGSYTVVFLEAGTNIIGTGTLHWSGSKELTSFELNEIRKALLNNMKVENNQLIIYENDGTTVYKTYNLFDLAGAPTNDEVYEIINA